MTAYCEIDEIKKRMLIELTDTQYDTALNDAVNEATFLVDIFIKPYVDSNTTPLLASPDNQIIAITADFGASLFKRRMLPEEVGLRGPQISGGGIDSLTQMDATGWFALALKKLETYIRNYYVLSEEIESEEAGYTLHNPDVYLKLFNKGIITGKEARKLINDASESVIAIIESHVISKELSTNETITSNATVTESSYKTKQQKSFAFIDSDPNNQSGYKKESEYNGE